MRSIFPRSSPTDALPPDPIHTTTWVPGLHQWCLPRAYSRIRRCCLMMRGRSVNRKMTVTTTQRPSKPMINAQSHSIPEKDCGQPCQKGNEAPMETKSQRHESKPKNRVLGRLTTSRTLQLPVSKLSGYDSIRSRERRTRSGTARRVASIKEMERNHVVAWISLVRRYPRVHFIARLSSGCDNSWAHQTLSTAGWMTLY